MGMASYCSGLRRKFSGCFLSYFRDVIHENVQESDHKPISFAIFFASYTATDGVTESIPWENFTKYKLSGKIQLT